MRSPVPHPEPDVSKSWLFWTVMGFFPVLGIVGLLYNFHPSGPAFVGGVAMGIICALVLKNNGERSIVIPSVVVGICCFLFASAL